MACLDPAMPEEIVIVHRVRQRGDEAGKRFDTFGDWFRAAVDDMVRFD